MNIFYSALILTYHTAKAQREPDIIEVVKLCWRFSKNLWQDLWGQISWANKRLTCFL